MRSESYRVCLIEDDQILGEALSDRLEVEGFACDWFESGGEARTALGRKRYDVAISDIRLPDESGEELFTALRAGGEPLPPFIFITGFGAVEAAVRLLKLGAEDYLTKPFDVGALIDKVRALCVKSRPHLAGEPTLGISRAMRALEAMLPQIAGSAATVLVTGESGVGKEEVARALHRCADTARKQPFVAVNCGALTESLLEAELFGHEKGAFTGAVREKKGYFEQAHGGTLFLDEIGDMPPAMQVKLLRVIQERQIQRVGGESPIPVRLHLVCATHQDLKKMVEQGTFREDLYYRIHVIHLHVPPLRERKEDILWLAERFLDRSAAERGEPRRSLHRLAEKPLLDYPWPGNIRELKHVLDRALILTNKAVLSAEDLFEETPPALDEVDPRQLAGYLAAAEKAFIERALRRNARRIAETAADLGISRKNLWEKMRRHGIGQSGG
ncbi:MAG: sigma-54-dependent Fis family transcriptional regulator [Rhodocyclales bacterium CG17_big_fil_post_rev_8_21_14_2_50_68_7]|nr:MAG: sigma-54-dependent Fis family transcriptional regulator [Rhodocyclales bacterium CG17_big_fil_post_rev_8_21_14_2_50_68_7]